jgi:hypothetical protein
MSSDGTGTVMLAAALNSGFGSYAQFNRIFHQHMVQPDNLQKEARIRSDSRQPLAEQRPRLGAGRNGASSQGQAAC